MRLSASLFLLILLISCSKSGIEPVQEDDSLETPTLFKGPFSVNGSEIQEDGVGIQLKGVNALQTFGLGDPSLFPDLHWLDDLAFASIFLGFLRISKRK